LLGQPASSPEVTDSLVIKEHNHELNLAGQPFQMCRFGMHLSGIAQWISETDTKMRHKDRIGSAKTSALDLQRWQAEETERDPG
jgi:hypothetical protein